MSIDYDKLANDDLKNMKEITFGKEVHKKLNTMLAVSSTTTSVSLCTEFIQNWFMSKFGNKYFKSIHIDDKHVLDDYRVYTKDQLLKREKPALAITPQLDTSFDREKLDLNVTGLNSYMSTSSQKHAFFKDNIRHVYLNIVPELLLINFNFKVKVGSKAEALDVHKYMKNALKSNLTIGEHISLDFHIPYSLMLIVAKDAGFEISEDNKIKNMLEFLSYLNSKSEVPFLYKRRNISGNCEFFVRISDIYVHINSGEVTVDDGEKEGKLYNNYIITYTCAVRFPSAKFFSYFTYCSHDLMYIKDEDGSINNIYRFSVNPASAINENGWNFYLSTEYLEENVLDIDLCNLFTENSNKDLHSVITYFKEQFISPSTFIDLKVYNEGKLVDVKLDWDNMTLKSNVKLNSHAYYIIVYLDLKLYNNLLIEINSYYKSRVV